MATLADGLFNLVKSLEHPKGKAEELLAKLVKNKKESTFLKLMEIELEANPLLVNHQDPTGFTMLHYASALGYLKIVEFLLAKNASDSLKTTEGISPLGLAEQNGHTKIVNLLNQPRRGTK